MSVSGKQFPNYAGVKAIDYLLIAELEAAGIEPVKCPCVVLGSPEVKTKILGTVADLWTFTRYWHYWVAEGPGIPADVAMQLHEAHGKECRVGGHCEAPSPLEWFKGFGVGHYHVDTPRALKALADTIKSVATRNAV